MNSTQHSGTCIQDLMSTAARVAALPNNPQDASRALWERQQHWAETYFATGVLIIPVWSLLIRIRERLCDGADDNGQMSPGAVDAWYNLAPLQDEFVMGE